MSRRDRILAWFLAAHLVVSGLFAFALFEAVNKPGQVVTTTAPVQQNAGVSAASDAPSAAGSKSAGPSATSSPGASRHRSGGNQPGGSPTQAPTTGPQQDGTVRSGQPLTFGSIVMQNFSISFTASKYGTQAYLAKVNAAGGANGHKINMIFADDQGNAATGYQAAQSLVNKGVLAFAAFNAPETEGYSGFGTLVDKNKIPLIGSYGESKEYHDPYMFAFSANYVHFGYEMGRFLVQKGSKTPAMIYVDNSPDTTANDEIERGFKAGISSAGGDPSKAVFDKVSPTQATFDSDVSQFQLQGVDGIASILDKTGYVRFLQSQARANYYPTHVADPLFNTQQVKGAANTASHPVYVIQDLDFVENGAPAVKEFANAMRAMHQEPTYLAEVGWLDAKYLVEAVSRLKTSFTRADLLNAVNSLGNFDNGFTSPMHISPGYHDMNRCLKFGLITNGTLHQVQGWTCDTQKP